MHVLDPFGESGVDDKLRSRYNPLDAIDMDGQRFEDETNRLVNAIIVKQDQGKDKFFDETSKDLLRGVILHVKTHEDFEGRRNLETVRELLSHGEQGLVDALRSMPMDERVAHGLEKDPCPYDMLWQSLIDNPAWQWDHFWYRKAYCLSQARRSRNLSGHLSELPNRNLVSG